MTVPTPFAAGLYASGQPSPADLAALAAAGVRTVVNLRAADEPLGFDEAREVELLGMRYVAFPIAGPQDVTPAAAIRFARELDRARNDGATLLHCASANRVGALVALDQGLVRGASLDAALALGRAAGLTSLEAHVTQLLGQRPAA
jgi:protein tyrosine phosphatase (PTP) superfamily phosphohydrolase (DUF442 family)